MVKINVSMSRTPSYQKWFNLSLNELIPNTWSIIKNFITSIRCPNDFRILNAYTQIKCLDEYESNESRSLNSDINKTLKCLMNDLWLDFLYIYGALHSKKTMNKPQLFAWGGLGARAWSLAWDLKEFHSSTTVGPSSNYLVGPPPNRHCQNIVQPSLPGSVLLPLFPKHYYMTTIARLWSPYHCCSITFFQHSSPDYNSPITVFWIQPSGHHLWLWFFDLCRLTTILQLLLPDYGPQTSVSPKYGPLTIVFWLWFANHNGLITVLRPRYLDYGPPTHLWLP